ncbi:MAG: VCBS repeat-containing protein [Archangiaceae bacterium]|nr:VCBS repeat-containing protein [Archangiaceae bacterium]
MRIAPFVTLLFLSACGVEDPSLDTDSLDPGEEEPVDDESNVAEQGLVSCAERKDTGYRDGRAYSITVVSADGKPAELAAANAYSVMQRAAAAAGVQLRVVSGFRTMEQQRYFYHCYTTCSCNSCSLAAVPGYSKHQSGHAFDLNTSDSRVYNWLVAHGAAYGFRRTVPSEKWHWEWWGGGPGGGPCGHAAPPPAAPALPDEVLQLGALEAVGSTDLNGDGKADVCARNSLGITCYLSNGTGFPTVIDGPNLSNASGWSDASNYSTLRMADYNGDGKADLCARANTGMMCWPSTGSGFGAGVSTGAMADAHGWNKPEFYSTIRMADVNGDGKADLCARGAAAFFCWLSEGAKFASTYITGPLLANASGWDDPTNYATLRMGDVNGDGKADVCARSDARVYCWLSNGAGFPTRIDGPALASASGWDDVANWSTLRLADINGDGKADLCARANASMLCYLSQGTGFGAAIAGPALADMSGWNDPNNYSTIRLADVDGDGDRDICARSNAGMRCWLWTGAGFTGSITSTLLADAQGWANPVYYQTIRMADVTGDGKADLCARGSAGVFCWPSTGTGFGAAIAGPAWTTANGWSAEQYYTTLRIGP